MSTAITPKQIRTMLGLSNRELGGATRALYKRGWVNLHRSGARYEAEAEYKINDNGIRAMLDYEAHPPQPKTSVAKQIADLRLAEMESAMRAGAYWEVLKEVRELLDDIEAVEWEETVAKCIRRIDEVLKD
jgi:hypothetical protein